MDAYILDLPGCKSASQRALILAALAQGESRLEGLNCGQDSQYLCSALQTLGWGLHQDGRNIWHVEGSGGPITTRASSVQLGEGGSTLRFLAPVLAAAPNELDLYLAPGLRVRPQQPLVEVLEAFGARLTPTSFGFHLNSKSIGGVHGGVAAEVMARMEMPVNLSSQFFSGFLMAAGSHAQRWNMSAAPVSRGYLEMTVTMLRRFRGLEILQCGTSSWLQQPGFGHGQSYAIPSDASAVVFFAVAAILTQHPIRIRKPWNTLHPDARVLRELMDRRLLKVSSTSLLPLAPRSSDADPLVFDLEQAPDSGPALAVLVASLPCGGRFLNPQRLRFKESNRIEGMRRLVALCGGELTEDGDELCIVSGCRARTQTLFDPAGDHRLAMAAGIATLVFPGVNILQRECVGKSFPNFWKQLAQIT